MNGGPEAGVWRGKSPDLCLQMCSTCHWACLWDWGCALLQAVFAVLRLRLCPCCDFWVQFCFWHLRSSSDPSPAERPTLVASASGTHTCRHVVRAQWEHTKRAGMVPVCVVCSATSLASASICDPGHLLISAYLWSWGAQRVGGPAMAITTIRKQS